MTKAVPLIQLVELADRPAWSGQPRIEVSPGFDAAQLKAIELRHDAVTAEARRAITVYLADSTNVFLTHDEGFPSLDRLSGEYYFGDRSYNFSDEPWFKNVGRKPEYSFEVQVRFLERPNEHNASDRDYLALSVCFVWSVEQQQFEVGSVDAQVI